MALTIDIDGYGVISDGQSLAGYACDAAGVSPEDEIDAYFVNAQAISCGMGNKDGNFYYDIGLNNELDFSPGGAEEDQLVYIWYNVLSPGLLDTIANGGFRVRLGTGQAANFGEWDLHGQDTLDRYPGGWRCVVVDPTTTPTTIDGGASFDLASIRYFGFYINMSGSAKYNNIIIQYIAAGKGLRITGTDVTGWQEVSDYCNDYTTRAWGMMQERAGIYYSYGTMTVSGASFSDDSRIMKFDSTEYYNSGGSWVPTMSDNQNGILLLDDGANALTFTDGVQVGSGDTATGRSGTSFIGSGDVFTFFDADDLTNGSSDVNLYGTGINNFQTDLVFEPDLDHELSGVTFAGSGMVRSETNVVRNCTFSAHSSAASASFYWEPGSTNIKNSNFLGNTLTDFSLSGYGVMIPTSGSYSFSNLNFSGNDWDILYTGSPGTTATINSADATNHPSTWYAPYGGTVEIIVSVTLTLTGLVSGSEVRIYEAGTTTEVAGVEDSGISFSYDYNFVEGTYVDIVIHHVDYVYQRIETFLLPGSTSSIPVQQQYDRWYSNP